MSATMKNVEVLACWIGGHYFNSDFRPVPLCEYLVSDVLPLSNILLSVEFGYKGR